MNKLAQKYGGKNGKYVFLLVYIREAHASNGWKMGRGGKSIKDPKDDKTRRKVAGDCVKDLGFDKTMNAIAVDSIKDEAMVAYAAWPERLFLIGKDGKVKYVGGQGPRGFKPMDKSRGSGSSLESALKAHSKKAGNDKK